MLFFIIAVYCVVITNTAVHITIYHVAFENMDDSTQLFSNCCVWFRLFKPQQLQVETSTTISFLLSLSCVTAAIICNWCFTNLDNAVVCAAFNK